MSPHHQMLSRDETDTVPYLILVPPDVFLRSPQAPTIELDNDGESLHYRKPIYTRIYIYIFVVVVFFLKGKKSFISRYVQVFRRFSLCLTSGSHEVLVYTTMISACARRGETAEAEEWLWEMHRLDARSGTTGRTRWITWL